MIDLYAYEMEMAALQAEAQKLGMPRALLVIFDDMRTKVFPRIAELREKQGLSR